MTLTDTQKLQIKKFFGLPPKEKYFDPLIAAVEDGGALEAEVVSAIAACQTAYDAWQADISNQDGLLEAGSPNGGMAKFSLGWTESRRKKVYLTKVDDLARLLDIPGWSCSGGAVILGVSLL